MRLPTLTLKQRAREDARAFHESLWQAHLGGSAVVVPIGDETAGVVMQRLSSNHKNFWARRGYRFRQAQTLDKQGVQVWVEALGSTRADGSSSDSGRR